MPQVILKDWFSIVVLGASNQIVNSFFDPFVALSIVLELGRHVVAQVVRLVLPYANKVWLEQCDLIQGR